MTDLTWGEPPPVKRPGHDWALIARCLREQPGEWARVADYRAMSVAKQMAYYVRTGQRAGMSPAGTFEATARAVDGVATVYARFIGEAVLDATVTEYGVLAWSKHLEKHHVDACDDYESALSTLDWTRRKVDAGALLVSRPVAAPGPVGEWRAVSPDDAAVAFETAKAGAQ
jgi:hypothetical protein